MTSAIRVNQSANIAIDSILEGVKYDNTTISYSFIQDPQYAIFQDPENILPLTAFEVSMVESALRMIETFSELRFISGSEDQTNLRFYSEVSAQHAGAAYFPDILNSINVGYNPIAYNLDYYSQGETDPDKIDLDDKQQMFVTVMHEIGHALGLKHPDDPSDYFANDIVVGFPFATNAYTVVGHHALGAATSYMSFDVAAIQYMYGANFEFHSDDTRYVFEASEQGPFGDLFGTITASGDQYSFGETTIFNVWDGGGDDTYDFSELQVAVKADLSPGGWISFDDKYLPSYVDDNHEVKFGPGLVSTSFLYAGNTRSIIENIIGSEFSDKLQGNQSANKIEGGGGDDQIDGGSGEDTAIYRNSLSNYLIRKEADGSIVVEAKTGSDGEDTLVNVEFGRFAGERVDLSTINSSPTGLPTATLAHGTEDTAYTISASNLLAGFSDADGDTLAVSSLTASNGATVTNNGNGTYTITPAANYNGSISLSYNVTDGHGGTKAATQSFVVDAVNDAPTGAATATLPNGTEDAAYIVSANDLLAGFFDVDGDTLSVSNLTASNGAAVTNNGNGTYTITPAADFNGTLSLGYNVTDGHGGSKAVSRSVVFVPADDNHAPTGSPTAVLPHGSEDTGYIVSASNLLAGFSDIDGDTMSVDNLSASNGATVTNNGNGTYTITPAANYNGPISLSYNVIDSQGGSKAATQSVVIDAANDAPAGTATATLVHGTEDTAYIVSASDLLAGFSDADGDTLSVASLTASHGATIADNGDGTYTITPAADFNGALTLGYDVTDSQGGSKAVSRSIVFDAAEDNHAPTGSPTAVLDHGTEDAAYIVSASDLLAGFSDADGDTLLVSNLTASNGATVVNNDNGTYTINPAANYNGPVSLSYDVIDNHGGTKAATQSVVIDAVNDAPTRAGTADLAHGAEDTPYVVSASDLLAGFSDVDGDALSITNVTASHGATVVNNGNGTYTINPAADFNGTLTLSYDVTDGQSVVAGNQSIEFEPSNHNPAGTPTMVLAHGREDSAYIVSADDLLAGFTDADGDALSVWELTASDDATVADNGDGTFTITTAANFNGTLELHYYVKDDHGNTTGTLHSVVIDAVNDRPTGPLTGSLSAGTENTPFTIATATLLAGFSDVDSGDAPYVLSISADHASITVNNGGGYNITPDAGFTGTLIISYEVADGHPNGSVAVTRTVTIASTNHAPTAIALSATSIAESAAAGTVIGTLTGTDPDQGDTLAFSLISNPNSMFVIVDGKVQLAAGKSLDFETKATYDITVRATDSDGASFDKAFTINVTDVNEGPISGSPRNETLRGTAENDTIQGFEGHDTLDGGAGADELDGGSGKDTASYASAARGVTASLWNPDMNTGDAEGDTYIDIENIRGSNFADRLFGNGRANVIDGGKGNDSLFGGGGRDTFVFGAKYGKDTITDFDSQGSDHDVIDLSGAAGITSFKDLIAQHIKDVGSDLVITAADGSKLTLQDVDGVKDLAKGDFLF